MKYKVILNTETNYLHITTSDVTGDSLVVLFEVDNNLSIRIGLTLCKCFCLGYLQGNNRVKVNNSVKDFE